MTSIIEAVNSCQGAIRDRVLYGHSTENTWTVTSGSAPGQHAPAFGTSTPQYLPTEPRADSYIQGSVAISTGSPLIFTNFQPYIPNTQTQADQTNRHVNNSSNSGLGHLGFGPTPSVSEPEVTNQFGSSYQLRGDVNSDEQSGSNPFC